jgi:hypothetical protein
VTTKTTWSCYCLVRTNRSLVAYPLFLDYSAISCRKIRAGSHPPDHHHHRHRRMNGTCHREIIPNCKWQVNIKSTTNNHHSSQVPLRDKPPKMYHMQAGALYLTLFLSLETGLGKFQGLKTHTTTTDLDFLAPFLLLPNTWTLTIRVELPYTSSFKKFLFPRFL